MIELSILENYQFIDIELTNCNIIGLIIIDFAKNYGTIASNNLKVVSNKMNGRSDMVLIENYSYITQVLGLSSSFYCAVVF